MQPGVASRLGLGWRILHAEYTEGLRLRLQADAKTHQFVPAEGDKFNRAADRITPNALVETGGIDTQAVDGNDGIARRQPGRLRRPAIEHLQQFGVAVRLAAELDAKGGRPRLTGLGLARGT